MKKTHLLAPGPTPVPEAARLAMAATLIHHRGPGFKAMFSEVSELLRWAHQTDNDVLVLTCSGTGGFEAAMSTFTEPSDTVIAIGGGKFGERWGEMSAAFGMKTVPVDVTWGKAVDVAQVRAALQANPNAAMLTVSASETSTGVYHPMEAIAEVLRDYPEVLFAVDGITAVGVHRLPMDELGIDILVSGSQKAFSVPPGLAFVAVSGRRREPSPPESTSARIRRRARRPAARGRHARLPEGDHLGSSADLDDDGDGPSEGFYHSVLVCHFRSPCACAWR